MTGTWFSLTFALAAPFWALMILLPGWSWTTRVIRSPLIVLPVLGIYAVLVLPALDELLPVVASPTLTGVRDMLGTDVGAAAAWAHLIAFDLFAGRWAWLDGRERGAGVGHVPGAGGDDPVRAARAGRLPGAADPLEPPDRCRRLLLPTVG